MAFRGLGIRSGRNIRTGMQVRHCRITSEDVQDSSQYAIEQLGQSERSRYYHQQHDDRLGNERQTGDPQFDSVPPRGYRMHGPTLAVRHAEDAQRWRRALEKMMMGR